MRVNKKRRVFSNRSRGRLDNGQRGKKSVPFCCSGCIFSSDGHYVVDATRGGVANPWKSKSSNNKTYEWEEKLK